MISYQGYGALLDINSTIRKITDIHIQP